MTDTNPALVLDRVSVSFGDGDSTVHALDDVSLDVGRGEIVCLVGESGSGKSVTARTIMGLSQLDRSLAVDLRMRFAGEPIDGPARAAALRGRELAMVFQEPMSSLDPLFTIESQLTESLRRRHGRLPRGERRARIRARSCAPRSPRVDHPAAGRVDPGGQRRPDPDQRARQDSNLRPWD